MNPNRLYPFVATLALLTALPAHAHHAMGGQVPSTFVQGLLSGLAHPVIGVDHFAFLLVVGLLAVSLTGAARFLVPGAFVAATVAGTGIHLAAVSMPLAEITVAFSVLLGGLLVLMRRQLPALLLGGGLGALQAASVSTGLPFAVVLLFGCFALVKGLLSEPRVG